MGLEHSREGRRDRHDAAGVLLAVVDLRSLKDHALMGGATDLRSLAVEDPRDTGKLLSQPRAGCRKDTNHCLVAAGPGEAVHLLEAEDADWPNGLRSATSSVIASLTIAESERRMPTAPVVALPWTLGM